MVFRLKWKMTSSVTLMRALNDARGIRFVIMSPINGSNCHGAREKSKGTPQMSYENEWEKGDSKTS